MSERLRPEFATAAEYLAAPRFVTALTTAIIGVAACAFALRQTIGLGGLIGMLCALVVLASLSLAASWGRIQWRGILPISLLAFVGWATVSIVWSRYHWATLGGIAYLAAFTILALYVALLRDTIQVVRSFGDVLRFVLALSLAIEILSGVLIDAPIRFLSVLGNLADLGPIQGVSGARNQLGIVALIALVTFGTEFRTHLIPRGWSIGSMTLAGICLLLTKSPLAFGALVVVGLATAALYGLRRVRADRRRLWQVGLLALTVMVAALGWAFRSAIVTSFNAGGDLTYRLNVWRTAWNLIGLNSLQGWGWIGRWQDDIEPFKVFTTLGPRSAESASNAFVDVWFQLGLIGLALFLGLVGLAFVRSWLLASGRRNVVFAWPALLLVTLIVTSLAESSILVEFGWLSFVVCTLKAAQQLSWRQAFAADHGGPGLAPEFVPKR